MLDRNPSSKPSSSLATTRGTTLRRRGWRRWHRGLPMIAVVAVSTAALCIASTTPGSTMLGLFVCLTLLLLMGSFIYLMLFKAEQSLVLHEPQPAPAAEACCEHAGKFQALEHTLETLTYAIAHDLRAPLRAIEGFVHRLTEDISAPLSESASRDLAGIRQSVTRMQEYTGRWLRFAQLDFAAITREPVDLTAVAHAISQELQALEPQRTLRMITEPHLWVLADRVLVEELMQNLISNAWKFTRHNTAATIIEIGGRQHAGEFAYFVRDNGIGFEPQHAERLFRPFERLHSTKHYYGTGIGLTIAQRIVERHGGRIWAEGAPNQGATFWFTLS